jgi:hypothetical protein
MLSLSKHLPLATLRIMNRLCYGDNLHLFRDTTAFPDAGVDLTSLNQPFNR